MWNHIVGPPYRPWGHLVQHLIDRGDGLRINYWHSRHAGGLAESIMHTTDKADCYLRQGDRPFKGHLKDPIKGNTSRILRII